MTKHAESRDPVTVGREALNEWRQARPTNYFSSDAYFQGLAMRHLGARYSALAPQLLEVGATAAGPMELLAFECGRDHRLPRVERVDSLGNAIEAVVFDPAYHELGEHFWASRVLAELEQPGRELLAGAIAYLLDHVGEAGHACPVACTAGAIKLLQQVGSVQQQKRYLPGLLDEDYGEALRAAQFVTEVQGGSDVGANACSAEPDPERAGWYRISGEKWFCSVADADLFVVSARLTKAPDGTRGLGLFLVPRLMDGRPNGFTLNRLKDKIGSRAMATGEIQFQGALGEAVGALDQGFRHLVGIVLDTSRVHNAVSACGLMRRAYLEAHSYASTRRAFGVAVASFPAVQEILARMRVASMAALATTFRILAVSDRLALGEGDDQLLAARRIDVMLNKYWTAIRATRTARDGIEILGGNGTIEDFSVLPRLYRDAIVIESWEGTHNTLIAQVLRDFSSRGLHEAWLATVDAEIQALPGGEVGDDPLKLAELRDEVADLITRAVQSDGPERRHFRHVVDRMCRLRDLLELRSQARWEAENAHQGVAAEAAALYELLEIRGATPITDPRPWQLVKVLAAGV